MIEEEIYEAQENPPSAYIDGKSLAVFVAVCLEQITFFASWKQQLLLSSLLRLGIPERACDSNVERIMTTWRTNKEEEERKI